MAQKINFKQVKYIGPAILYFPLLGLGYLIIDIFHTDIAEKTDGELQTTEYINPNLPNANLRDDLGSKRENVEKTFGKISDFSAMENIENDIDSVKKKEDFQSNYTEKDLEELAKNAKDKEKKERYNKMREQLLAQAKSVKDQSGSDFVKDISDEERQKIDALRGANRFDEVEKALGLVNNKAASFNAENMRQADAVMARVDSADNARATAAEKAKDNAVNAIDDNEEAAAVVKKVKGNSDYFNTLSANEKESNMIKAIIDENIKAVDGSRVRLRLLDDVTINGILLKRNSYLYCTMSGFGSQRVKGKIESIMVEDHLEKVSLSIYDLDGLEGLYVPESHFRSAAKDVSSQALQGNMNIVDGMSTSTNFASFAANAIQNGYQRVTNAISKNIRKNKAKIKYGTHVYLVNSSQKREGGKRGGQNQTSSTSNPSNNSYQRYSGNASRPSLRNYGYAVGQ